MDEDRNEVNVKIEWKGIANGMIDWWIEHVDQWIEEK